MATGTNIRTYYKGRWSDKDELIMRAGDHGAWLGSTVFDGARYFDGVVPDLRAHCDRVNNSARAMMITPSVTTDDMVSIIWEGLRLFPTESAVYIRPMYWAQDGGDLAIIPKENSTGFAICLEDIPMANQDSHATLTTTSFRRPVLEDNVVNAKAGCLYPNNARMLAEARKKGYSNALVCDVMGNVAETATANIFLVKDGEVLTPISNGTFLAGITRDRHILNLKRGGFTVFERVLTPSDFLAADEVFMSGNMMKVTAVSAFQHKKYQVGPVSKTVREMYWDWALSEKR